MKIASRPQTARAGAGAPIGAVNRAAAAAAATSASGSGAPAAPAPVTSLMGIPAEEVTPKVRTAIEALMREVDRLRKDLDDLKRKNGELEKIADEDAMLPVVNRRAFVRELSRAMAFSQRYEQPSSLGYFDVNNMKTINDTLGHAAGDAVLMHVAETLLKNVRQSDTVGRLGGDEFGVVMAQMDDETARIKAAELAERISAQTVDWDGQEIEVSIAHGHYTFDGAGDPSDALIAADQAMYAQKQQRRAAKNAAARAAD